VKKLFYRKFFLFIILPSLFSIRIQAQNGWTIVTTLPTVRVSPYAAVIGDSIYVIGGTGPNLINMANNELCNTSNYFNWNTLMPMPTPRGSLTGAVVNDIIFAIGGGYPTPTDKNEAYDPVSNSWDTTKADMPTVKRGMKAVVLDGIIYVIGGNDCSRDCYAYNPATNIWTQKDSVPVGGGGVLAAAVYNGLIYTFGGGDMTVPAKSNVYSYNPLSNSWDTTLTPMPTPRYAMQAYVDVLGEKIYVIGGSKSQGTALSTVEIYDPVNDTWEQSPDSLPVPLCLYAGAVVNNKFYVISGTSDWLTGDGSVWEYTPPSVPAELTSFTALANGNKITLNWSTATETNNRGFEIQRNQGNQDFIVIGFVQGNGTTTQPHSYTFTDPPDGEAGRDLSTGKYSYRLKQVDFDGSFEYSNIVEVSIQTPDKFSLEQNYPNPFNPTTTLSFVIGHQSFVTLKVYDVLGNEVATLVNGEKPAGNYKVQWNAASAGGGLSSGVYFYQLIAGKFIETKKMILLK
jgi:N-acetylneuraminic acid mutarotase